jgi:hypothetical protein
MFYGGVFSFISFILLLVKVLSIFIMATGGTEENHRKVQSA